MKEKTLQVETSAPSAPGDGGIASLRPKQMQRQLAAVKRVTETLEQIRAGLPLLFQGEEVKLQLELDTTQPPAV